MHAVVPLGAMLPDLKTSPKTAAPELRGSVSPCRASSMVSMRAAAGVALAGARSAGVVAHQSRGLGAGEGGPQASARASYWWPHAAGLGDPSAQDARRLRGVPLVCADHRQDGRFLFAGQPWAYGDESKNAARAPGPQPVCLSVDELGATSLAGDGPATSG